MDTITFICTIIGGIAAIYGIKAYFKDHVNKGKEQIEGLKVQFKSNQQIALQLRERLIEYAQENNAMNEQFFQGVTFSGYIALLTQTLENDLSDQTLEKATCLELTESIIRSMSVSLDSQCANLLQVKNYFQLYFKSR